MEFVNFFFAFIFPFILWGLVLKWLFDSRLGEYIENRYILALTVFVLLKFVIFFLGLAIIIVTASVLGRLDGAVACLIYGLSVILLTFILVTSYYTFYAKNKIPVGEKFFHCYILSMVDIFLITYFLFNIDSVLWTLM